MARRLWPETVRAERWPSLARPISHSRSSISLLCPPKPPEERLCGRVGTRRHAGAWPRASIPGLPVLLALGAALLFSLVFGPQWWVRRAMQQHATERPDLPGTGGELARHLLDLA